MTKHLRTTTVFTVTSVYLPSISFEILVSRIDIKTFWNSVPGVKTRVKLFSRSGIFQFEHIMLLFSLL